MLGAREPTLMQAVVASWAIFPHTTERKSLRFAQIGRRLLGSRRVMKVRADKGSPTGSAHSRVGLLQVAVLTLSTLHAAISYAADAPRPDSNVEGHAAAAPASSNLPYWAYGNTRLFLSGRAVGGLGFARLALNAGYGKPHWFWAGPEVILAVTPDYLSGQGGLHLSAFVADLTISFRRTSPFQHNWLNVADSIQYSELSRGTGRRATPTLLDASLWGFIPYGQLLLTWELTYVKPFAQSNANLLYEEIQHVVITKDGVLTTKLGPMLAPFESKRFYLGALAEHLSMFGRTNPLAFRVGPSVWARLTDHAEFALYLTLPVKSPDSLGLWGGMYGSVAVVYRFATQEQQRIR